MHSEQIVKCEKCQPLHQTCQCNVNNQPTFTTGLTPHQFSILDAEAFAAAIVKQASEQKKVLASIKPKGVIKQ